MVVKSTAIGFLSHVVKIKTKIYKKKSHGYCRTVPWLLEEGQQLPWLWWPAHLIVITQTMFSICDAAHLNWTENLEHAGLAQKNGFASAHFSHFAEVVERYNKVGRGNQQLAVLYTEWPAFFHLTSDGVHHSPFLLAADHYFICFEVCF